MKLISVWKLSRRRTDGGRYSQINSLIINAFHHSGRSKAIIDVTLWRRACSEKNFSVEKMHVVLLELMSIIERKTTDDWPGWLPRWANCIVPDQAGLHTPNSSDVFQSTTSLVVVSVDFLIQTFLYLIYTSPLPSNLWYWIWTCPDADISVGLTFLLKITCVWFVPGVTVAINPIPWNVSFPSNVLRLWSTLSATYWTNSEVWVGMPVPWVSAAFFPNLWTSW